ncbi:MAG: prevent-host-death protein [Hyphomicrobiaceae bacterium]|nr:prevent-host-death protein [Hyphomicrobiaceae bacterium]
MDTIPVERGDIALEDLARRVEAGERVVLTRGGEPVAEVVAPRRTGGFDPAAMERFKRDHGIDRVVTYIAEDFDDPLPEDFLLRPLPDPALPPK